MCPAIKRRRKPVLYSHNQGERRKSTQNEYEYQTLTTTAYTVLCIRPSSTRTVTIASSRSKIQKLPFLPRLINPLGVEKKKTCSKGYLQKLPSRQEHSKQAAQRGRSVKQRHKKTQVRSPDEPGTAGARGRVISGAPGPCAWENLGKTRIRLHDVRPLFSHPPDCPKVCQPPRTKVSSTWDTCWLAASCMSSGKQGSVGTRRDLNGHRVGDESMAACSMYKLDGVFHDWYILVKRQGPAAVRPPSAWLAYKYTVRVRYRVLYKWVG